MDGLLGGGIGNGILGSGGHLNDETGRDGLLGGNGLLGGSGLLGGIVPRAVRTVNNVLNGIAPGSDGLLGNSLGGLLGDGGRSEAVNGNGGGLLDGLLGGNDGGLIGGDSGGLLGDIGGGLLGGTNNGGGSLLGGLGGELLDGIVPRAVHTVQNVLGGINPSTSNGFGTNGNLAGNSGGLLGSSSGGLIPQTVHTVNHVLDGLGDDNVDVGQTGLLGEQGILGDGVLGGGLLGSAGGLIPHAVNAVGQLLGAGPTIIYPNPIQEGYPIEGVGVANLGQLNSLAGLGKIGSILNHSIGNIVKTLSITTSTIRKISNDVVVNSQTQTSTRQNFQHLSKVLSSAFGSYRGVAHYASVLVNQQSSTVSQSVAQLHNALQRVISVSQTAVSKSDITRAITTFASTVKTFTAATNEIVIQGYRSYTSQTITSVVTLKAITAILANTYSVMVVGHEIIRAVIAHTQVSTRIITVVRNTLQQSLKAVETTTNHFVNIALKTLTHIKSTVTTSTEESQYTSIRQATTTAIAIVAKTLNTVTSSFPFLNRFRQYPQ